MKLEVKTLISKQIPLSNNIDIQIYYEILRARYSEVNVKNYNTLHNGGAHRHLGFPNPVQQSDLEDDN